MTGIILGLVLGLLGLVPGLHLTTLLVMLVVGMNSVTSVMILTIAGGMGVALNIWQRCCAPVGGDVARMPAETQLVASGEKADEVSTIACRHFEEGAIYGFVLLGVLWILGVPGGGTWTVLPLTLVLLWVMSQKLGNMGIVILGTLLGFRVLHESALGDGALVVLLNGVFGLPIALSLFGDTTKQPHTIKREKNDISRVDDAQVAWAGWLGGLCGLLAGVSTSVIANTGVGGKWTQLKRSNTADGANLVAALGILWLSGKTRSGLAAGLAASEVTLNSTSFGLVLVCLAIGWLAGKLVAKSVIGQDYGALVRAVPGPAWGAIGIGVVVATTVWQAGVVGLPWLGAGLALAGLGRAMGCTNSAFGAVLMGPVWVYLAGLSALLRWW